MEDLNSPYLRLQKYYIFFANKKYSHSEDTEEGFTISELSQRTKIPKEIIRKDILFIYKNMENQPFILSDEIEEQVFITKKIKREIYFGEILDKVHSSKKDTNLFTKLINKCRLDENPFILTEPKEGYIYDIPLTQIQYRALEYYKSELKKTKGLQIPIVNFEVKDSYKFYKYYHEFEKRIKEINDAINNEYCLKIEYMNPAKKTSINIVKSIKIVYDSQENIYAILAVKDNKAQIYYLDRIITMQENQSNIKIDKRMIQDILKKQPNVWGMNFSEKSIEVKIRFYNEYNVWAKVKKDLEYRTNKNLYEEYGYLYYEDKVYME